MDYTIKRGVEGVLGDGLAKAIPGSGGGGVDREGDNPIPRGGRHWRCDFETDQRGLITQAEEEAMAGSCPSPSPNLLCPFSKTNARNRDTKTLRAGARTCAASSQLSGTQVCEPDPKYVRVAVKEICSFIDEL